MRKMRVLRILPVALCYGYNDFWKRDLPALDLDCDGFEIER